MSFTAFTVYGLIFAACSIHCPPMLKGRVLTQDHLRLNTVQSSSPTPFEAMESPLLARSYNYTSFLENISTSAGADTGFRLSFGFQVVPPCSHLDEKYLIHEIIQQQEIHIFSETQQVLKKSTKYRTVPLCLAHLLLCDEYHAPRVGYFLTMIIRYLNFSVNTKTG